MEVNFKDPNSQRLDEILSCKPLLCHAAIQHTEVDGSIAFVDLEGAFLPTYDRSSGSKFKVDLNLKLGMCPKFAILKES